MLVSGIIRSPTRHFALLQMPGLVLQAYKREGEREGQALSYP